MKKFRITYILSGRNIPDIMNIDANNEGEALKKFKELEPDHENAQINIVQVKPNIEWLKKQVEGYRPGGMPPTPSVKSFPKSDLLIEIERSVKKD